LKRVVAILLLGILFFNWYGYQLLSVYLQDRADHRLEASLDRNNYDESQLINVKVPITTLSYYNSSNSFERVDGKVEIGGIQYKYVKRRLFKDSLELLCLPNQAVMGLRTAKNEFFRQVNGLQQQGAPGKKAPASAQKNLSKDYCSATNDPLTPGLQGTPVITRYRQAAGQLPSRYTPTKENPPDQDNAALS
jgi:hypothetical protein